MDCNTQNKQETSLVCTNSKLLKKIQVSDCAEGSVETRKKPEYIQTAIF